MPEENKEQFEDYYLEGFEKYGYEKAYYEEIARYNAEWKAKWPNHCQSCGGWGGHVVHGVRYYPDGSGEPDSYDPCENLPDDICHRCRGHLIYKQDGQSDDDGMPTYDVTPVCESCGWQFDDGVRE
jgi:hypothetical protein